MIYNATQITATLSLSVKPMEPNYYVLSTVGPMEPNYCPSSSSTVGPMQPSYFLSAKKQPPLAVQQFVRNFPTRKRSTTIEPQKLKGRNVRAFTLNRPRFFVPKEHKDGTTKQDTEARLLESGANWLKDLLEG